MSRTFEQIDGTLTMKDGSVWNVELCVTTVALQGSHGIEDEAVARVELRSKVPDGEYTLDYFCFKHHCERVRVQNGVFVAA